MDKNENAAAETVAETVAEMKPTPPVDVEAYLNEYVSVKLFRGFFTMTNIIANKVVYEEFLQHHFCTENIVPAVERILPGGERRQEVEADMLAVRNMLAASSGSAARQAALAITAEEAGK